MQPMEHRRDIDVVLEDTKAALEAVRALLTLDEVFGAEVQHAGQHDQLAVVAFGLFDGSFVDGVGEALSVIAQRDSPPARSASV